MKFKSIVFILAIILFSMNCNFPDINIGESQEAKRLEQQNQLLSLLLILVLNSKQSELTFPNYKYSFSAMRQEVVNENTEDICTDILIWRDRDPDKVITGYESGRIDRVCRRSEDVDFVCMTDLTLYVSIHYFNKSENSFAEKRDYCRDELNGVFVL
ncbi:MAG: hypothetical protein JJT78_06925 [Leptospira sp.]|nr:hypothetical protein [Leptospira sp.]